jgi:hypothetical protein
MCEDLKVVLLALQDIVSKGLVNEKIQRHLARKISDEVVSILSSRVDTNDVNVNGDDTETPDATRYLFLGWYLDNVISISQK